MNSIGLFFVTVGGVQKKNRNRDEKQEMVVGRKVCRFCTNYITFLN